MWSGEGAGLLLDGLGGILLADEHLQQTQLSFHPLVLLVLIYHGGTVLLLHIPGGGDSITKVGSHGFYPLTE